MYQFQPRGVCARLINFDVRDGNVHDVSFVGGCNGNLKANSKIIEGMPAEQVISILEGNDCAGRGTSCTDQLTQALRLAIEDQSRNAAAVAN
ncbi:uncharacterized protein NCTC11029_00045 [Slackia heliotrinireducens]|uniref:ribonucleoside-diphosphate reductase n=1 Tax=Slackia heliotrinireducens (strain ATCC 29202 / DSM 20476 / NCTC 11029 / RHS 1) TaxID=471855 RepID=C7N0X4_SLAHD|nr:TIGR03905 family TSCPD domain-containing protein [Slackia heliotrinireducens]ACV21202.1 hypothetical protein Shel_01280 [Slackia heliotrinireducens DSM 20476]VEG98637.1 uncharacterized protein NCTC11029_00045 [Slackia heliotrinireducens]